MKYLRYLAGILALLLVVPVTAQASESIAQFNSDVTVDSSATATIAETIVYDFGPNQRRGIYRDVPTYYEVNEGQGYVLAVEVISVLRNGIPEQYEIESDADNVVRIKIGNPDVYITGENTYTVTYKTGPVVVLADDGNAIVRIDAPGTGWSVPVSDVSISLRGPEPAINSTCYQGYLGSNAKNCIKVDENTYKASNELAPGQVITHEASFNSGAFTRYAMLQDEPEPNYWPAIVIGGLVASAFVGLGIKLGYAKFAYNRRKGQETVYPRYEPPKGMTPAEVGLLVDNSISGAEISATLLHFAVDGYMKIVQTKQKRWWRKAEYDFIKLPKDDSTLPANERAVFAAIFTGKDTVSTKNLQSSVGLQKAIRSFKKKLVSRLQDKGFYKPVNIFSFDLASRMNDAGYSTWAEVEGFRQFLSVTEKDRLAFHDAPERKPEQFSALLPYAVALGVEKAWAEQFKDITLDTSDWYQAQNNSSGIYSASALSHITKDFSSVTASFAQASSSGTSGGGGGFSGGGFSGGGGGSW